MRCPIALTITYVATATAIASVIASVIATSRAAFIGSDNGIALSAWEWVLNTAWASCVHLTHPKKKDKASSRQLQYLHPTKTPRATTNHPSPHSNQRMKWNCWWFCPWNPLRKKKWQKKARGKKNHNKTKKVVYEPQSPRNPAFSFSSEGHRNHYILHRNSWFWTCLDCFGWSKCLSVDKAMGQPLRASGYAYMTCSWATRVPPIHITPSRSKTKASTPGRKPCLQGSWT